MIFLDAQIMRKNKVKEMHEKFSIEMMIRHCPMIFI
jgi:hypothetical protein